MLLGLSEANDAAAAVFLGVATYKPADSAYASAGILVRARLNFTASST